MGISKRENNKTFPFLKFLFAFLLLAGTLFYFYTRPPDTAHFQGVTMGTRYNIKIPGVRALDSLKEKIESRFEELSFQMSLWEPNSEISRFNRFQGTNFFDISSDFRRVLEESKRIHAETGGAFDSTIEPVVECWGFGANLENNKFPPPAQKIELAVKNTGMRHLKIRGDKIRKTNPLLKLNVNALAKGYAVDEIFELLYDLGYTNLFIEIGGEIRTAGLNADQLPWRIGLEAPVPASAPGTIYKEIILKLSDKAIATSGNYRNYQSLPGKQMFGHLIDPRTGYPTTNNLLSVSVIASTCMEADALSTALFIMGKENAFSWVNTHDQMEAFFVSMENGKTRDLASPGFQRFILNNIR